MFIGTLCMVRLRNGEILQLIEQLNLLVEVRLLII